MLKNELLGAINAMLETHDRVIIAIDGRSGAGKTTLAAELARSYGAAVVSTDHFFLPGDRKTAARLNQPGGNIDYERFFEQVSEPLYRGKPLCYGVFDCAEGRIAGQRKIPSSGLIVVEGVYSLSPRLALPADIPVMLEVSPDEQLRRLRARENPEKLRLYLEQWIPLEERYFKWLELPDGLLRISG